MKPKSASDPQTMTEAAVSGVLSVKPFEFTIQSAQPLRTLISERMRHLLGCDPKTKTVRSLNQLDATLGQMIAHLQCWNVGAAFASLRMLEAQGFASAARVLIGADPTILDKAVFVSRATSEVRTITQALDRELEWYKQLVGASSSAAGRLAEVRASN